MKKCTKCGTIYPATLIFFYRNRQGEYGLRSICKQCERVTDRKRNKIYREKNHDHYQKYKREYRKKLKHSEKGPRLAFVNNIHQWIKRHKSKQVYCSICNEEKKLELSNISGEYKRDINDYQWLCNPCHRLYDKITQTHKSEVLTQTK